MASAAINASEHIGCILSCAVSARWSMEGKVRTSVIFAICLREAGVDTRGALVWSDAGACANRPRLFSLQRAWLCNECVGRLSDC